MGQVNITSEARLAILQNNPDRLATVVAGLAMQTEVDSRRAPSLLEAARELLRLSPAHLPKVVDAARVAAHHGEVWNGTREAATQYWFDMVYRLPAAERRAPAQAAFNCASPFTGLKVCAEGILNAHPETPAGASGCVQSQANLTPS